MSAPGPEHSKPLEKPGVLFGQEPDPRLSELYSGISPGTGRGGQASSPRSLPSVGRFLKWARLWGLSPAEQRKPVPANSVPTGQPLFAPGNSFGASRPAESFR